MNQTNYLGSLSPFDYKINEWEVFHSRLSQFIKLNSIPVANQSAVLLTYLSDESYRLVRNLVHPKKLEECTYSELVEVLNKHFTPKRSTFADRAKFYEASRADGEGIEEWAARLRGLAVYCDFGTELDTLLRDRFVLGFRAGPERDKLFECDSKCLTFGQALEVAQKAACARQARVIVKEEPVFRVGERRKAGGGQSQAKAGHGLEEGSQRCTVCGFKSHSAEKCKFRNLKCNRCGLRGHLQRLCKNKGANLHNIGAESDSDCKECDLFNMRYVDYCPIKITVNINEIELLMELDSGSGVSVISESLYLKSFEKFKLYDCNLSMCVYTGHKITPLGYFIGKVSYKDRTENVQFYVIKDGGPPLLGRDFMAKFGIYFALSYNNKVICKDKPIDDVQRLLEQYPDIWKDDLGWLEGVSVWLDDVCITGPTKEIHLSRLHQVLAKLQDAGLRLQKDKCVFFQNRVVNYYRNFIPSASAVLSPLHELLRAGAEWRWGEAQQAAFEHVKKELASDRVLAHFDASAPLVLTVDAGPCGLGAVLAHRDAEGRERPIAFASRALRGAPARAPPSPWPRPPGPWHRIHIDYMAIGQSIYLIVIDAFSKWLECVYMDRGTSTKMPHDSLPGIVQPSQSSSQPPVSPSQHTQPSVSAPASPPPPPITVVEEEEVQVATDENVPSVVNVSDNVMSQGEGASTETAEVAKDDDTRPAERCADALNVENDIPSNPSSAGNSPVGRSKRPRKPVNYKQYF
ncbi:uncharacterized protein [Maniola hyperantus]|uniref:uncharacterized protein n=1 Tax=Aphantopus hyperantus TaxID=2795564 RepID=UPI0037485BA4